MAGKSRARNQAAEQDQSAQIAQLQAEQAAMQQQQYQQAPAAAPAPAADPQTAELERLAGLHQSGVLTDEEFTAAKAKVLGI